MATPEVPETLPDQPPPLTRKERLAAKFENWPLIRLMIFSPAFLIVVLLFLAAGAALALAVPKIWRTTPPGFTPEVKVSLLDFWQVRSLRSAAQAAEQRGEFKAAFDGWRASWANNFADQTSMRGVLAVIPKLDNTDDAIGAALQAGYWLLRVGATNTADLELITRAWINTRNTTLAERAARLLDFQKNNMPESLERLYLMALFQSGRTIEFGNRIQANAAILAEVDRLRSAASGGDAARLDFKSSEPKFEYYCLAYLIGWGTDADRGFARQRLREARQNRLTEQLAFDLEFITMFHLRDTEACGALLRELQDVGLDGIRHHVGYWTLLVYDGRRPEAERLAQSSNLNPRNGFEAFRLAQAYVGLGMSDRATDLISRFGDNTGWAAELLVLEAELLRRAENWDGLRSLALRIRMMPRATDFLGGYSSYLEGLALWRSGDQQAAKDAFERLIETGIGDPSIAFQVAEGLTALGGVQWAQPLLLAHREALGGSPEYLRLLVKVGSYLREGTDILVAAKDFYDKRPNDPIAINNYAAALMIFRQEPTEALNLTRRLVAMAPFSAAALANYASALAICGRYDDAETVLKDLNIRAFSAPELAQYYLSYFEVMLMTDRFEEARRYLRLLDRTQLYPAQVEWLDQAVKRLEAAAPTADKG
jgi:tetratricopeptide (TPR) repeat protein